MSPQQDLLFCVSTATSLTCRQQIPRAWSSTSTWTEPGSTGGTCPAPSGHLHPLKAVSLGRALGFCLWESQLSVEQGSPHPGRSCSAPLLSSALLALLGEAHGGASGRVLVLATGLARAATHKGLLCFPPASTRGRRRVAGCDCCRLKGACVGELEAPSSSCLGE